MTAQLQPNRETDEARAARILIVEDENVLRMTFEQFLVEDGYDVVTAENYNGALEALDDGPIDAVVTDIIMAGKSGVDLLRSIRDRGLDCPVVMITGEPTVQTASQAVRLGAFDYLAKPVTGADLKRVVRYAVDRRRLESERDRYAARADMLRREFEAIFQSVNEGIVTVDVDLRIRQVNEAAEAILGEPPERLTGLPFSQLCGGQLDAAREALESTILSGKAAADLRTETSFGSRRKVLAISTSPLIDRHGVHTGAVLVLRDLTRLTDLEEQLQDQDKYRGLVGKSVRMQEVFALVESVAQTDTTVLLCGESGTGKELVAAALHRESARSRGPFIKVNCAALSEEILESELFGHVKGAFTGAVKDRVGRFEAAAGGTILLDEIGDISPRLQLRLLRVLQEKEFERVGASHPIRVDVRIVAATNQDLTKKIERGEFRQDLYFRLNVVRIEIPPLRERPEDIVALAEHFCKRFNAEFKKEIEGLSPEAFDLLLQYPWPGNVRELENGLERAFVVCQESVILPRHLPTELTSGAEHATSRLLAGNRPAPPSQWTRETIFDVLEQTDWNIAKSARRLGMARNTLYQKMKQFEISRPED